MKSSTSHFGRSATGSTGVAAANAMAWAPSSCRPSSGRPGRTAPSNLLPAYCSGVEEDGARLGCHCKEQPEDAAAMAAACSPGGSARYLLYSTRVVKGDSMKASGMKAHERATSGGQRVVGEASPGEARRSPRRYMYGGSKYIQHGQYSNVRKVATWSAICNRPYCTAAPTVPRTYDTRTDGTLYTHTLSLDATIIDAASPPSPGLPCLALLAFMPWARGQVPLAAPHERLTCTYIHRY